MQVAWEILVEGQSLADLKIKEYMTDLSITHRLPKGKGSPPHEASLKFVNPEQVLSGYFRQLDNIKIWLGSTCQLFYQGEFKIYNVKHNADESSQPTLTLDLVCSSFSGARKHKSKAYLRQNVNDILSNFSKNNSWKLSSDLVDELVDIAQTTHETDYSMVEQIGRSYGRHVYMVYPEKLGTQQTAMPTLVVKKAQFDNVLDPTTKAPIQLTYGMGDPNSPYLIQNYSVSIDVKRPSLIKGGKVDARGDSTAVDKATLNTPRGNESTYKVVPEDPAASSAEIKSGETGPKVPAKAGLGDAGNTLKELVNAEAEKANKIKLSVNLVQPVPFFFAGFLIGVKGIKLFEGTHTIAEVSQTLSGSEMLRTSLVLLSNTGGAKVSKSIGEGGQTPGNGDEVYSLTAPRGANVTYRPVREVTAK